MLKNQLALSKSIYKSNLNKFNFSNKLFSPAISPLKSSTISNNSQVFIINQSDPIKLYQDIPLKFKSHILTKKLITRKCYQFQNQLRKCLSISDCYQLINANRQQIFKSQNYATIIIQFINQLYLDPKNIIFQNSGYVYELIYFLQQYMDKTDQQGNEGFAYYQLSLFISTINKMYVFFTTPKLFERWIKLNHKAQSKLINIIQKQQLKNASLQNRKIGIAEAHNIIYACQPMYNKKLLKTILKVINDLILFQDKSINFFHILFLVSKKTPEIGWDIARNYSNIWKWLIDRQNNFQPSNLRKACQTYLYLINLKLHIVGPKTIPPVLKDYLNYFVKNIQYVPPKLLLQILRSFNYLPRNYEKDNYRIIFQYCKNKHISGLFILSHIPFKKLTSSQTYELFNHLVINHKQTIWSDSIFLVDSYSLKKKIFKDCSGSQLFIQAIKSMMQHKLKKNQYETFPNMAFYISLGILLLEMGQTRNAQIIVNGEKKIVKLSYAIPIINKLYKSMERNISQNSQSNQLTQQAHFMKVCNQIINLLSINNLINLLILTQTAYSQRKKYNIQDQYSKKIDSFFARFSGFIPSHIEKRTEKCFFNTIQSQILSVFQHHFLKTNNHLISSMIRRLICFLIIKINESKKSEQALIQHNDKNNQQNTELISESKALQKQILNNLFQNQQIPKYIKIIEQKVDLDMQLHFKILFILFKSIKYNQQSVKGFFFNYQLANVLLQKIKPQQEIIFIQYFLLYPYRDISQCKYMFDFLNGRKTSLKNILYLIGGLSNTQLKSGKGSILSPISQYLNQYSKKSYLLQQEIKKAMKDRLNYDTFLDLKTVHLALQKLCNFYNSETIKQFVRIFSITYLNFFPLPSLAEKKFDQFYEYNSAFDILQLCAQSLMLSFQSPKKQNKKYKQINQDNNQQNYENETSVESKYSIQKKDTFVAYQNLNSQIVENATKILTNVSKLNRSIQIFKKNIAIDSQTKDNLLVYHSLRHLLKTMQIRYGLSKIIKIDPLKRQNMFDEIILERQSNITLNMYNKFPNQWRQNSSLSQNRQFHSLNSDLLILKMFCFGKIDIQTNKMQLIKCLSAVQHSVNKGKLTLIHIKQVFGHYPESFAQILDTLIEQKQQQTGKIIRINCKQRFNQFLLPIIQKASDQQGRIIQTSLYFVDILTHLIMKHPKTLFQNPQQRLYAFYSENQQIIINKNYNSQLLLVRYANTIKKLIKKMPKMWSASTITNVVKRLIKLNIYDIQIANNLAHEIKHNSYYVISTYKLIYLYFSKYCFNVNTNSNINFIKFLEQQNNQVLEKQISFVTKNVKSKNFHQYQNQPYVYYLCSNIYMNYNPIHKNSEIQVIKNLIKNQYFLFSLNQTLKQLPKNVQNINKANKNRNKLALSSLQSLYIKVFEFVQTMISILIYIKKNNQKLYNSLGFSNKQEQRIEQINSALREISLNIKKKFQLSLQNIINNNYNLQTVNNRDIQLQNYLKMKGFQPIFNMKFDSIIKINEDQKTNIVQQQNKETKNLSSFNYFNNVNFDYFLMNKRKVIITMKYFYFDQSAHHLNCSFKINFLIYKLWQFLYNEKNSSDPFEFVFYDCRLHKRKLQTRQISQVLENQKKFLSRISKEQIKQSHQ